jgi:hypothetical protein
MIKANLVHLSYNMWMDTLAPEDCRQDRRDIHYAPVLRFDRDLWRELVRGMAEAGMNMVLLDVGDGVRYRSRPEIAVEAAWSPDELAEELRFCREHGVELVPKLNFSACHDAWLGPYSRCVSTEGYYSVCRDLIAELVEMFDGPRLFHLGMDEETWDHQKRLLYVVVRQGELWWHDLNLLAEAVRQAGSQPWVWSDVLWHCEPEEFSRNMPRDVVQSNWYYRTEFGEDPPAPVRAYRQLQEMGYAQIPTASTWVSEENYPLTVQYCSERLPPENLLGFMMADWRPTTPEWRSTHLEALRVVRRTHAL